jgi:hypothetical protein
MRHTISDAAAASIWATNMSWTDDPRSGGATTSQSPIINTTVVKNGRCTSMLQSNH